MWPFHVYHLQVTNSLIHNFFPLELPPLTVSVADSSSVPAAAPSTKNILNRASMRVVGIVGEGCDMTAWKEVLGVGGGDGVGVGVG